MRYGRAAVTASPESGVMLRKPRAQWIQRRSGRRTKVRLAHISIYLTVTADCEITEPVSSTIVHQCGTVVATCSGQRHLWERTRNFSCITSSVAEEYRGGGGGSEIPERSDTLEQPAPSRPQFNRAQKCYDNTLKVWSVQGFNPRSSSCRMDISDIIWVDPA